MLCLSMVAQASWMLADFRTEQRVWMVLVACGLLAVGLAILI